MATGLMSLPVFLLYKVDLRIFDCSVLASELFGWDSNSQKSAGYAA